MESCDGDQDRWHGFRDKAEDGESEGHVGEVSQDEPRTWSRAVWGLLKVRGAQSRSNSSIVWAGQARGELPVRELFNGLSCRGDLNLACEVGKLLLWAW